MSDFFSLLLIILLAATAAGMIFGFEHLK